MSNHKPESILDGAFLTVLLMVILAIAVMIPLLLCEFVAALAYPSSPVASAEQQAATRQQRDELVTLLNWIIWPCILVLLIWKSN